MAKKDNQYKLTNQQMKFCESYVLGKCSNAYQAALNANYAETTAKAKSSEWLEIVGIKNYIADLQKEDAERNKIDKDEIIQLLKTWAFSDITQTLELTTQQVKELPIEVRRLVTQYKKVSRKLGDSNEELETIELKFVSKEKAVELLNRMLGFNEPDRIDHSTLGGKIKSSVVLPDNQTMADVIKEVQEAVDKSK